MYISGFPSLLAKGFTYRKPCNLQVTALLSRCYDNSKNNHVNSLENQREICVTKAEKENEISQHGRLHVTCTIKNISLCVYGVLLSMVLYGSNPVVVGTRSVHFILG